MVAYVGIDIGTTHIKSMAATDEGEVGLASIHTPWISHSGNRELDPDVLVAAVLETVTRSLDSLQESTVHVAAVGVTSMGEAGLYVSDDGPLGYIGGWQDVQSTHEGYRDLMSVWDVQNLFERTGISPSPKFGLFRMRAQWPSGPMFRRQSLHWLSVADFIVWHLTGGVAVTHASLAARTLAYDWRRRGWDSDLLQWTQLCPEQLPKIINGTVTVGEVRVGSDARLLGAEVIHAGHDHVCAAFGADLQKGELMDSTGTAEPLLVREGAPMLSVEARKQGVMWGPSLFDDESFVMLMPTPGGGASEVWARDVLTIDSREMELSHEGRVTNVQFEPWHWEEGKAQWMGLGYGDNRLDLYWAVLDGVAESLSRRVMDMEQLMGSHYTRMKVVGGIVNHKVWVSIRSHRLGREQDLMQPENGALVGAIRSAATAVGVTMPVSVHWIKVP